MGVRCLVFIETESGCCWAAFDGLGLVKERGLGVVIGRGPVGINSSAE